ncbi:sensor histidine kinase [Streptococcus dentasini]
MRYTRVVRYPTQEDFQKNEHYLKTGQYHQFPLKKIAPKDARFAVLDQSGQLVYASPKADLTGLNKAELGMIEPLGGDLAVNWSMTPFTDYGGQKRYLLKYSGLKVVRILFDSVVVHMANENTKNDEVIHQTLLDQDFKVISSSFLPKGTSFQHLGPLLRQKKMVVKYSFTTDKQENLTLVLYYSGESLGPSFLADNARLLSVLAILSFYVLIALLFAIWLNRKVRMPLNRLRQAINNLTDRSQSQVLDYQGPSEFVEIIEDFNQVSDSLRRSEEESQRLQAEKQEMLANISHDLKTPITVIKGYSEAMRDGLIKPEQQDRYLEAISQKSRKLTHLIDSFHNYSKIDHPDFALQLERLDICLFLQNYLDQHRQEFELKGYRLKLSLPREEGIFCHIDSEQFERVLDNLLANFFRHSPEATTLFVGLESHGGDIDLVVADDGVGINPEQADQLFQAFVTGDKARPSKAGSGLGLAIVQRIIDEHGGSIRLEQPPRAPYKTVFVISLPL